MSQITGLTIGTPFADSFVGSVEFTGSVTDLADEARAAISNASIYSYGGNDTIIGTSKSWSGQGQGKFYQVYGVYQGLISSGQGNDTLRFEANASSSTFASAVGILDTILDGGQGNDTIQIAVVGRAEVGGGYAYGQIRGVVKGGYGNDVITISAHSEGFGYSSIGVDQGRILGDHGNDQIYISASGSGKSGSSIGLTQGLVDGGEGNDSITIRSDGFAGYGGGATGVGESKIQGGGGNDEITVITIFGGTGSASGLFKTQVNGDQGDDLIRISATSTQSGCQAYGVSQAQVFGGNGQDTFIVGGTTLALDYALIDGGNGKDTFDVGFGNGTVNGGNGTDLIFLNFFDANTMAVKALSKHDLIITGNVDAQGTFLSSSWTQTILNMEQFQVGSNLFTNAGEVAAFLQSST